MSDKPKIPKTQNRTRPLIHLTLSPEAIDRIREISERSGKSRSALVEQWAREAKMPPPRKT